MDNNLNENPLMTENGGLSDETLEMFKEFMAMVNATSLHPEIDLECAICMNILIWPQELDVCKHVFCGPCIIRLTQAGGTRCPLCRAVFRQTHCLMDLHKTILQFYEDYCQERYNVEMESGVFNNLVREVTEDGIPTYYIARRL